MFDGGGYESEFSPIEMCSCLVNSIGVTLGRGRWGGCKGDKTPPPQVFIT